MFAAWLLCDRAKQLSRRIVSDEVQDPQRLFGPRVKELKSLKDLVLSMQRVSRLDIPHAYPILYYIICINISFV